MLFTYKWILAATAVLSLSTQNAHAFRDFFERFYSCEHEVIKKPGEFDSVRFICKEDISTYSTKRSVAWFHFQPNVEIRNLENILPKPEKVNLACLIYHTNKVVAETSVAFDNMDSALQSRSDQIKIEESERFNFFYKAPPIDFEASQTLKPTDIVNFECEFPFASNHNFRNLPKEWFHGAKFKLESLMFNQDVDAPQCEDLIKTRQPLNITVENGVKVHLTSAPVKMIKKATHIFVIPLAQEGFTFYPMILELAREGFRGQISDLFNAYLQQYKVIDNFAMLRRPLELGQIIGNISIRSGRDLPIVVGVVTSGFGKSLSYQATHTAIDGILKTIHRVNRDSSSINVSFPLFNAHGPDRLNPKNWAIATLYGIHKYASNVTKPKIKNIYLYDYENFNNPKNFEFRSEFCLMKNLYHDGEYSWPASVSMKTDINYQGLIDELTTQFTLLKGIKSRQPINLLRIIKHLMQVNREHSFWHSGFKKFIDEQSEQENAVKARGRLNIEINDFPERIDRINVPWQTPVQIENLDLVVLAEYLEHGMSVFHALETMYGIKKEPKTYTPQSPKN